MASFIKKSFPGAFGTFVYVTLIAFFLSNAKYIFGEKDTWFIPIFMLLLLIFSASLTGFMVLGRPFQLYFDGHRKEAITLFFATLGWIFIFGLAVAIVMISIK